MKQIIKYQAEDGQQFDDQAACLQYEQAILRFHDLAISKVGPYRPEEFTVGDGILRVRTIPCEAPWMSPQGACLIKIIDFRRDHETGNIEFQLGDKDNTPYLFEGQPVFVPAGAFFDEWPD